MQVNLNLEFDEVGEAVGAHLSKKFKGRTCEVKEINIRDTSLAVSAVLIEKEKKTRGPRKAKAVAALPRQA
jgi:hypothetical protein